MDNKTVIGTLNEHTLHSALKNYIEPDSSFHERKIGRFVVDIERDGEVFEIETVSFTNIKRKLPELLKEHKVTVIYPISKIKWIVWVNQNTGEMTEKRKSPKKGRPSDIFRELIKLKEFTCDPNFRLKIIMMEMVEYKKLDNWSRDGKHGAERQERIPLNIIDSVDIESPRDYSKLIDSIPSGNFTASEFASVNKMRSRPAWCALQVLMSCGIIKYVGKNGRAFLYEKSE